MSKRLPFILLLTYGLLGFATGGVHLFPPHGVQVISGASWKIALIVSVLLLFLSRGRYRSEITDSDFGATVVMLSVASTMLFFSDFVGREKALIVKGQEAIAIVGILALFFGLIFHWRYQVLQSQYVCWGLLVLAQGAVTACFLDYAAGRMIFSDDHPSFLYRLILLRDFFPSIPFYNTAWNAGYSAREFFPSGMLNVFALSFPWVYALPEKLQVMDLSGYTKVIAYIFIWIVPISVALAARLFGATPLSQLLAGMLAIAPSSALFEFVLKFGTIGFALSSGLFPLAFCMLLALISEQTKPSMKFLLAVTLVCGLTLTWHLMSAAFLPLVLLIVLRAWKQKDGSFRDACIVAVGVLIINGLSILTLLKEAPLGQLFSRGTLPGASTSELSQRSSSPPDNQHGSAHSEVQEAGSERGDADNIKSTGQWQALFRHWVNEVQRLLCELHPVLLVVGLFGIFFVRHKILRLALGATVLWFLFLASVGQDVKPQLELRRMILPLGYLLCLPSALVLERAFEGIKNTYNSIKLFPRVVRYVSLALLFASVWYTPFAAQKGYTNQTSENFTFAPPELTEFANAIRKKGGEGRVFFSGFILHELGARAFDTQDGGHVALMAALTDKELYASHYYHIFWSTVDPIPESYRQRGASGIEEFLNLLNISSVVTFKKEWMQYCATQPNYREVFRVGRFRLFERSQVEPGFFLSGAGKVSRVPAGLQVTPESKELVLKYRYFPKLKVQVIPSEKRTEGKIEKVTLFPVKVFDMDMGGGETEEVYFIGLRVSDEFLVSKKSVRITF